MSFNTITISRTLPVVGGWVKIPADNNTLPKITPEQTSFPELSFGVTSKLEFVEFPAVAIDNEVNVDYQQEVEDVALAEL